MGNRFSAMVKENQRKIKFAEDKFFKNATFVKICLKLTRV